MEKECTENKCMVGMIGYALCDPDCQCKCECGIHSSKKEYLKYYSLKQYKLYHN